MIYSIETIIWGLPKVITNSSMSWKARWVEAKKWKRIVSEHFILHHLLPPEPLAKATIHFTRYSSYTRGCDQDNLAASFKYVLDGLKQSRVIVDDNRNHVIPTYDIGPAARNEGFIRIKIEEITLMGIG